MNGEATPRLRSIFTEAIALERGQAREAFLAKACGSNAELKREVEELLGAAAAAGGFLPETPAADIARTTLEKLIRAVTPQPLAKTPSAEAEKAGDRIGRYKLLEQIGEGGCGIVFMAEQEMPVRRRVALKIIKPGMDTKNVIARFEAERQALALMDHPNIAKVFDGGVVGDERPGQASTGHRLEAGDGRPFFVMELVRGTRITDYCDEAQLTTRERLELFIKVCRAAQHAHQKGIIHRDIKPSNLLVTVVDGVAVPKVIDFGIAKAIQGRLTDRTVFTAFEQFIGTPAYTSPEQTVMTSQDVDTRSDIYSLGVVLYELLTGETPFEAKALLAEGFDAMRRIIREKDPEQPSTRLRSMPEQRRTTTARRRQADPVRLIHLVRGDLDAIVGKCLEKEPARRYQTAQELAEEVERFLRGEPILARPVGTLGRAWRWCRRRPGVTAAASMILVLLLVVAIGAPIAGLRIDRERRAAQENVIRQYVANGTRLMGDGDDFGSLLWYAEALRLDAGDPNREEPHRIRIASVLQQAPKLIGVFSHGATLFHAEFSPKGDRLATCGGDETARIWDVDTGGLLRTFTHSRDVYYVAYSPDGRLIVTACGDGTARIWDTETGAATLPALQHGNTVWHVAFSPAGDKLATVCQDGYVRVWNPRNGELLLPPLPVKEGPLRAGFSPDGKLLGVLSYYNLTIWEAATGRAKFTNLAHCGMLLPASFSPDGTRLAKHEANSATLLNLKTGEIAPFVLGDSDWMDVALFSPDGSQVLTCQRSGGTRLWDSGSGKPAFAAAVATSAMSAAFSPDGACFVTGGLDSVARVWSSYSGAPLTPPLRHPSVVTTVQFNPDGRRFLTMSGQQDVRVWDLANPAWLRRPTRPAPKIERRLLDAKFERVLLPDTNNVLWLRDVSSGKPLSKPMPHPYPVLATWFSPDERMILTSCATADRLSRWETFLSLWDTNGVRINQAEMRQPSAFTFAAFSPDGRQFVDGGFDSAHLWEIPSGRHIAELPTRTRVIYVGFGAAGKTVITIGDDSAVRVWDARTGMPLSRPLNHRRPVVQAIQTEEDPQRLCVVAADGTTQYWDLRTAEPLGPFLPLRMGKEGPKAEHWTLPLERRPVADLVSLAQIFALSQVDPNGVESPLPAAAFTSLLGKMREKYPGDFSCPKSEATAWHRQQVEFAAASGRTSVAGFHLDRMGDLNPMEATNVAQGWLTDKRPRVAGRPSGLHSWRAGQIPPRDPRCTEQSIDLSAHFNFPLPGGTSIDGSYDGLDPGLLKLGGVLFDIRGGIRLDGRASVRFRGHFPERVDGIRVGRRCNKIHFLQSAPWEVPIGTQVSRHVLHFRDGTTSELPVRFGEHVAIDWFWYENELLLSAGKIVWTGNSPAARYQGYSSCLTLSTRENPHPELELVSMDFVSELSMSSPILFAVTVE